MNFISILAEVRNPQLRHGYDGMINNDGYGFVLCMTWFMQSELMHE